MLTRDPGFPAKLALLGVYLFCYLLPGTMYAVAQFEQIERVQDARMEAYRQLEMELGFTVPGTIGAG